MATSSCEVRTNSEQEADFADSCIHQHDPTALLKISDELDRLDGRSANNLRRLNRENFLKRVYARLCIGRNSSIYHVLGSKRRNFAVKVFTVRNNRTAEPVFHARQEFRALERIADRVDVNVPGPIMVTGAILVTEFIGTHFGPAPSLCDVEGWGEEVWNRLYWSLADMLRTIFQKCELVNGQISDQSVLIYNGQPWLVDWSGAVRKERFTHALKAITRDCKHITKMFTEKGMSCIPSAVLRLYIISDIEKDDLLDLWWRVQKQSHKIPKMFYSRRFKSRSRSSRKLRR